MLFDDLHYQFLYLLFPSLDIDEDSIVKGLDGDVLNEALVLLS